MGQRSPRISQGYNCVIFNLFPSQQAKVVPNNDKDRTYAVSYVPKVAGLHKVSPQRPSWLLTTVAFTAVPLSSPPLPLSTWHPHFASLLPQNYSLP